MKRGKLIDKTLGITVVRLMIGVIICGLLSAADSVGATPVDGMDFASDDLADPSQTGSIGLNLYDNHSANLDFDGVQALVLDNERTPWVQTSGPSGGVINAIEIDPIDADVLYAGGAGGGVFKTTNGGATWTMLEKIVSPSEEISDILVSPDDPRIIYALASQLWKSTDGGGSWRVPDQERWFSCVAMDPANPSALIAGTWDGRVYHSANRGENWRDITGNLPEDRIADIAIGSSSEFWVGGANGHDGRLYHSTNGGISWQEEDIGKQADWDIHTIAVDPDDDDVVYVGLVDVHNEPADPLNDIYLVRTKDGGATWMPLRLPGTDSMINVMGRAPTDHTLYVGAGGNVYRSNDDGEGWTWIGPPGRNGDMYDIAVDPHDSDVLYLPRRAYGIVKSTDGGATWTPINQGLLNVSISLLAVPNVSGSGTVYATAVSGEGTFRTTDYGNTWISVTQGGITHPWADELVVSPHDPETVWEVADVAEVFETTDGGATWRKTINTYGDGFRFGSVHAIAPAPSDPDTIYALKSGFGVFKSTDCGARWQFLHQSEVDYTYSIVVHPTNPDIVYSGCLPKPFQDFAMIRRTLDGGDSWETVLEVPQSSGITSVVIDPNDPDTIYAGSTGEGGGKVFRSTDGGDSWSKINEHFTMCTVWGQPQLIIDPNSPSIAYAATWLGGTWKTTDAGETWILLEDAPLSSTALSLNVQNTDVIYLADRSSPTVWKSTDAGSTWAKIGDFSSDGALLVMCVLADGNNVYASTFTPSLRGGKLYKSTDSGSVWTDITGTLPKGILDVAVDPGNPDIVYVTTNVNGAHKSTDGGMTWMQLTSFPDVGAYDIEVDPDDPTILYTSARGGSLPSWFTEISGDHPDGITFTDDAGVYRSIDSGETWSKILTTGASCRAIRRHPDNPNVLFAPDLIDGLQMSIDGGDNWVRCDTSLDNAVVTSCAIAGDKVYVGTQGCGVYSADFDMTTGAVRWQPTRSNKPVPEVYSMELKIDPTNSDCMFVGSYPGGLYCSSDGGMTFRDRNAITPSVVVDDPRRQGYYTFAINPDDTSQMWLGTWGKGIYVSYNAMLLDIPADMFGKHIYQIVVDSDPSNTIYVAAEEGVFKSSDDGATWSDLSTGLDTPQIRTLAMTADGTLLCGSLGYELYYYDTPGNKWRQMNAFGNFGTLWPIWDDRPLYQYTSLLFHPTDPNVIYFGTFPAGIYKSVDGGHSWAESNVGWTNDGVFSLVFHPENTDIVYAGTYNGVSRSTDAGDHWEMWDHGWPDEQWVFSIDFDVRDPNVMYACSKNGENEGNGREGFHGTVMKSVDGGATWFSITSGLDVNQEFYKVIVDNHDTDTLYVATQRDGVFISRDGGSVWVPWNEGLINPVAGTNGNNVANPMMQSADGGYLYFGSAGAGVFRRPTVTNMALDSDNDVLPDLWEESHFGDLSQGANDDPDGDGFTNLKEYDAGTDPNDAEEAPSAQYDLTISSTSGGSVTNPGEGDFTYGEGTEVDLVAEADQVHRFVNWTGDVDDVADVNDVSTIITVNGDCSITANFEKIPEHTLTISAVGGSVGTPGEGDFTYEEGTVVGLEAISEDGYQFVEWTGDVDTIADVEAASTSIIMNDDYSITANFEVAGGCFIATVAYGTPMAEEIQILREFRDEYLLTDPLGQRFVDVYYRLSPPLADFMTDHPSLKPIVRAGLMPVVAMCSIVFGIVL